MFKTHRDGEPVPPGSREVSAEALERILRSRIAETPSGSIEQRDALWDLMRFLGLAGRPAEALPVLDTLLTMAPHPENRAEIVLAMGQNFERMGDFVRAAEAYSRAIALEPLGGRTWYLLHNNMGYCLNQLGRHVEAERWCRTAIGILPERHNAYKNLGVACDAQGRHAEAARCFITAVRAEPADPRALRHLEVLAAAHPDLVAEIPDLREQIDLCRVMVASPGTHPRWTPPPAPPDSTPA